MKRTVCAVDEGISAQEPDAKRSKVEDDEKESVLQLDMQDFECVICAGEQLRLVLAAWPRHLPELNYPSSHITLGSLRQCLCCLVLRRLDGRPSSGPMWSRFLQGMPGGLAIP